MSRKEPKRSGGSDQNKAIARWDNEGGAPKAPQEDRNELAPLTNEEEHILRCLGAAVIMQWNDLPTKIQRELFEHASSMGELDHTAELKGQVARFLHQHKDDGRQSATTARQGLPGSHRAPALSAKAPGNRLPERTI